MEVSLLDKDICPERRIWIVRRSIGVFTMLSAWKYVKGDSKSFTNSSNLLTVYKDTFNDYCLSRWVRAEAMKI